MNCSDCTRENIEVKFFINGYPIIHCKDCDHLYTDYNPSPQEIGQIYSDDYFFKGGAGYEDYTLEKDLLIRRGEYYADKLNKYMNPGKVLDIGCAAGFILKGFENKKWEGTGVDPNKLMVEYGKHNLGLNLFQGTIETFELKTKFDLITIIQVAAHINDLNSSVNRMKENLNSGGYILFETWNKDSITARIFGKHWHEYSPPSTLNYFSRKTLTHFMEHENFTLIDHGIPRKSIHSKHAKSLISHKLSESKKLKWMSGITKLIPENLILLYPSEDLFWALYKKN